MPDIDAIRDEIAESNDPAVSAIGEYVTQRMQEGQAPKAGAKLKGAYAEMHKWAKDNQKNGCCVVPPERACRIIDEYFGFGNQAPEKPVAMPAREETQAPAQAAAPTPAKKDELDLDALLGG